MNTNKTEFRWFSKKLHACVLDTSSLSIGMVKAIYNASSPYACWLRRRLEGERTPTTSQEEQIIGIDSTKPAYEQLMGSSILNYC